MRTSTQIVQSFGFFCRHNPVKLAGIFILTIILGISQGVSIVMLIPLLGMLDKAQPLLSQNKIAEWLQLLLSRMGVLLSLELILVCFVILLVGIALLSYFRTLWQSEYEQGFIYALRNRLFRKIVMSDWNSLSNRSRHMHLQVLSSEIPKLSNYYFALMNLLTSAMLIFANVALSMLVSVPFTLLVVLIGGVGFVFLKRFLLKSLSLGGFDIGLFRQMNKQIDDFWNMIKQAKVHNAEKFYSKRYVGMNLRVFQLQRQLSKNRATSQLIFTVFGVVGLVAVVYVGCRLDTLPFTSIFVLILLFARLFPLFTACNTYLDMIGSNFSSAHLVLSLDHELSDNLCDVENRQSQNLGGDISLQNVSFKYGESNVVFVSINLLFPANSITGVVGMSGSGKTTLLDMITGLLYPQMGAVYVGGVRLTKEVGVSFRQNIGYLTQETYFVDGSIRENLTWDTPCKLADEEIMDMLTRVGVCDVVEREPNGLDAIVTNYSFHFSGGERQRLALVRVLLRHPKVLLLDEATSALDFQTEAIVMQCLAELKKKVTIIFVTHRSSLVPWFDQVVDLNKLEL